MPLLVPRSRLPVTSPCTHSNPNTKNVRPPSSGTAKACPCPCPCPRENPTTMEMSAATVLIPPDGTTPNTLHTLLLDLDLALDTSSPAHLTHPPPPLTPVPRTTMFGMAPSLMAPLLTRPPRPRLPSILLSLTILLMPDRCLHHHKHIHTHHNDLQR